MKIIEGNRFILEVDSKENEKFSIFRVSDILYYNSSLRDQVLEFFEHTPYRDKFNSGERKLEISINSEEERYELSYLFIKEGFKIRNQKTEWTPWCYQVKRKYISSSYFDSEKKSRPTTIGSILNPYNNVIVLYLRKKEVPKFIDFLEVLSKQYKYKTVYQDIGQSRNATFCCNENNYNYKKKYKLK